MKGYFNPRSPHGERQSRRAQSVCQRIFQSTLPARGATGDPSADRSPLRTFQSTLPARGATPRGTNEAAEWRFQSTLPARGATQSCQIKMGLVPISIHAPRTGSDPERPDAGRSREPDFNPRSPHGERRAPATSGRPREPFQSTLPARGATRRERPKTATKRFQSTLPARGATDVLAQLLTYQPISIHAPRTGSDKVILIVWACASLFQSTLPARGATRIPVPTRCR